MPDNPKEETEVFIEYPEIHTYQYDKKRNDLYITFYDKIMEKEYTILIEAYEFVNWVGSKEIAEIKENTIKIIEKL
tara:strand:- start:436 stop:663 length:228 start_codon:yes stop_codon:yes gene_type:complete